MHFFKIPFTASTENVIHLSFLLLLASTEKMYTFTIYEDTPNPKLIASDYSKMLALINVILDTKKMTMYIANFRCKLLERYKPITNVFTSQKHWLEYQFKG